MPTQDPLLIWLLMVGISVGFTALTYWGMCGLVHHHYYVRRRHESDQWKLQPKRFLSDKQNKQALWMGSRNMMIGAVVGGSFAAWVSLGGWSMLYLDPHALPLWWMPISAVLLFFMFDAGLYYSHRLMHHPRIFKHVHVVHHRFIAPNIFTIVATHPAEFVVFQGVLLACAFILPVHWAVYVVVVLYTYLIGAIDHVGAKLSWPLPLHSSNSFHNDHHIYFHCNFGHHTNLWDRLHGTVRKGARRFAEADLAEASKASAPAVPDSASTSP